MSTYLQKAQSMTLRLLFLPQPQLGITFILGLPYAYLLGCQLPTVIPPSSAVQCYFLKPPLEKGAVFPKADLLGLSAAQVESLATDSQ